MRAALLLIAALVVALVAYEAWPTRPSASRSTLEVSELLGSADAEGFARAEGRRSFRFPQDHGPHPEFRTEWWYFTGNLQAEDGREFGYQLTFFRNALAPLAAADAGVERASAWAAREVFMAHLAVSDLGGQRFFAEERFGRVALGLAGATASPFRIWLDDWEAVSPTEAFLPIRLNANGGEAALHLELTSDKPVVLQGDGGLSQKGPEPGNASWYYALTRMPTRGQLRVGDQHFQVTGQSWMDREWSTSALSPGVVGWDWFALHLSSGHDLMLYQLRTRDGGVDPFSSGTLVSPEGDVVHLQASEFTLKPLEFWTSPHTGTRYPIRWQVQVPSEDLSLEVTAALPDQELQVSVRYWEGSVRVGGTLGKETVNGRGYLELTGYAEQGGSGRGASSGH